MNAIKRHNAAWLPTFMEEVMRPDFLGGVQNANQHMPAVNIRENETHFFLDIAIPGKKKEDIKVEIEKNILTISSDQVKEEVLNERFNRREFNYGSFTRAFTLPKTISEDNIQATYEQGVLTLTLPKREETLPKPKRQIQIG